MDNLYVGRFYSSDKSCDEILIGRYTLICFYGLLAPLAYIAGEGIGAAIVEDTYLSYGFISIAWSISLLSLFKISENLMSK